MKKNLTLISLMLGVMMLVSITGMISASRQITSVTLNGASNVTVNPNQSAGVAVTVHTEPNIVTLDNDWKSTGYKIEGGTWNCVDTPDQTIGSTTSTATFTVNAPANIGNYDFQVLAFQNDGCTGGYNASPTNTNSSNLYTLNDGIVVANPYTLNTYESDYSTPKGTYYLTDTVYGKGTKTCSNKEIKLVYYYPNGTIAKNCSSVNGTSITCDFKLNSSSPLGTWTVQLQEHGCPWDGKVNKTFVVAPKCGDGIKNGNEQCDDGNSIDTDSCLNNCEIPYCNLVVDEPHSGFYDPITIAWHLNGNACNPIMYTVQYNTNCSSTTGWNNITQISSTGTMSYPWNSLPISGQYCVRVNALLDNCATGCCSTTGYSGLFNLDLDKPYVNLTTGNSKSGECLEGQTGDCYVNTNTGINLTCSDDNPAYAWQSGVKNISYQITGTSVTDQSVHTVDGASTTLKFEEDSQHSVEYWCTDKVGKVSDHKTKSFIVESNTPELTRTVTGPQVCPNGGDSCTKYFNLDTQICISLTNLPEHTVPGIGIACKWDYGDAEGILLGKHESFSVANGGCFNYTEDSYHTLVCNVTDALGNSYTHTPWMDIVDAKAPITTLSYIGPHYVNENLQWIDTASTINLTASDQTPHPVNGVTTYYREGIIDNKYCYKTNTSAFSGLTGEFTTYVGPFGLNESCHAVEYFSTDALGNAEAIKTEFVFSDHTAPTLTKVVGKPNDAVNDLPLENWYQNPGQNIEWKVTQNTSIAISCTDGGNHPSGVGNAVYSGIWYRVVLDGQYNDSSAKWQFVQSDHATIQFTEQSEHLLEFKCIDNVNKTSAVDSELFKVIGETFDLTINDKWDLVSVPFNLLSSDVSDIFGNNSNIQSVWGYENGIWKVYYPNDLANSTLTEITPGHGYWVKTIDGTSVLIGGSLFNPATTPSSVNLNEGWNLIGKYGTGVKTPACELYSLNGKVVSLFGYDAPLQSFVGFNNNTFTTGSLTAGEGYWLGLNSPGLYFPSSICA
jgi:cysteine-rich repeat protein